MATGTLPDAGQILNSLINSILLLDDDLAIHYANPAAQQLLAQSSRKLFGTPLPDLLGYFSLNIPLMRESLISGQGFTDNEVTLVVDGRAHILSLTAQALSEGFILFELAAMDNQRRLSQEQLQHAQQVAARDLVRGLAHEIKNPLGGLRGAAQLLAKALPDPSLLEYTKVIIEQADRLRNLVDRLLGPQRPGQHINQSIHQVAERVCQLVSLEKPDNVTLIRDYDPSLPELAHDPDQLNRCYLTLPVMPCRHWAKAVAQSHSAPGQPFNSRYTVFATVWLHGLILKITAPVYPPNYKIHCSTQWSVVARAEPALAYP